MLYTARVRVPAAVFLDVNIDDNDGRTSEAQIERKAKARALEILRTELDLDDGVEVIGDAKQHRVVFFVDDLPRHVIVETLEEF